MPKYTKVSSGVPGGRFLRASGPTRFRSIFTLKSLFILVILVLCIKGVMGFWDMLVDVVLSGGCGQIQINQFEKGNIDHNQLCGRCMACGSS